MLSKWLIARPKNIQPAAPRKHVVSYHESSEESEEDCYACSTTDESTKVIIKSEYNFYDTPSTEEEKPETALEAVTGEQQSGDGQSPEPEKKKAIKSRKQVDDDDDDEDQKNPAYVPWKRYFFEHDLRRRNDGVFRTKNRHSKKNRKDEGRWKHDKFNKDEQAPKSREELIVTYGYDIQACKNPDEIRPCSPTKQRYKSRPEMEIQNKERRIPSERLQCSSSATPKKSYKQLHDLHNRQSPPKSMHSDRGGFKGEQPAKSPQNKSTGPSSMSEHWQEHKVFQVKSIKQPSEGSSDQENKAKLAVKERAVDQRQSTPKTVVKMSYARTRRSQVKKVKVIELELDTARF